MLRSMTGFAAAKGQHGPHSWAVELRSVNGKGLDLRLRVPDWVTGLEAALKARLGKSLARGSVSLNLRITREEGDSALAVNAAALDAAIAAANAAETRAAEQGLHLAPMHAGDLLGIRGVLETTQSEDDPTDLRAAILAAMEPLIAEFLAMRDSEGAALTTILSAQVDQIETLTAAARATIATRRDDQARAMAAALDRVLDNAKGANVDPDRLHQELALIAVKSDITEEIDRLDAHVAAARDLIAATGPVGRKLDFLTQEFNREANTLCSKSQSTDLTAIGLDLKAVIDQLREQIQNVE